MQRRELFVVLVALTAASVALADDGVPLDLQADLTAKVATYDRNFAARAPDEARVLLLRREGDPASTRAANHLESALKRIATIGSVPIRVTTEAYSTAAAVREAVVSKKLCIVYVLPGLGDAAEAIATALEGADVLTVAAQPELVPKRIVLGFDLVSGKPKLVCHLGQARKQNVSFKAEALKLMRVYE